jgi:hypothetical protein
MVKGLPLNNRNQANICPISTPSQTLLRELSQAFRLHESLSYRTQPQHELQLETLGAGDANIPLELFPQSMLRDIQD